MNAPDKRGISEILYHILFIYNSFQEKKVVYTAMRKFFDEFFKLSTSFFAKSWLRYIDQDKAFMCWIFRFIPFFFLVALVWMKICWFFLDLSSNLRLFTRPGWAWNPWKTPYFPGINADALFRKHVRPEVSRWSFNDEQRCQHNCTSIV